MYSLAALPNVVKIYERGSGAKLNVYKTEAMWLGAWRSRTDQPYGLTWVSKMKILGVVFGHDTESDNWQPKLKKLENYINLWKSRSLSLVGKSLIINTLRISKLLYLATILPVPNWVISEVNNLIWPFLSGCRMETVSQQSCHQPFLKGGLGIVNFKIKADALKVSIYHISLFQCRFKALLFHQVFSGSQFIFFRNVTEWSFLRDNSSPSVQTLTPFYSKCLSFLASLRKILSCQDWRDFVFTSKNVILFSSGKSRLHQLFIAIGFLF